MQYCTYKLVLCFTLPNFILIGASCRPGWSETANLTEFGNFIHATMNVHEVCSSVPNLTFIDASCSPCWARKCKFDLILNSQGSRLGRSHTHPLSSITVIFNMQEFACVAFFHTKFHLDRCIRSPIRGKTPKFGQTSNSRAPYRALLIRAKFGVQEWVYGILLRNRFQLDRYIVSPLMGENPKCGRIFKLDNLCWLHLAAQRQSWRREHNYKTSPVQWCQSRF